MRKDLYREIVAQYLGNNQESLDVPWMDYMMRKNTQDKDVDQNAPGNIHIKDRHRGKLPVRGTPSGDGEVGKNLLDGVNDALSMNKEQDSIPANENDAFKSEGDVQNFPIEMNRYDRQDTPETSLKWWWAARERQDESTGTPWGSNLYGEGVSVSNMEASSKTAGARVASRNIHQILETSKHDKTEDFKARGRSLVPTRNRDEENEKKGLYEFEVKGDGDTNTVKIQFLKASGPTSNLLDHPCQLACDCDSFLFWGPQYYAIKNNYMYMPMFRPQILEPRDRKRGGRGKNLTFCKHIYAVVTHLTQMGVDPAYSDEVKENLLDIKDVPRMEDADNLLERFHVDRKTKFKQFIEDSGMHRQVYEDGLKLLKENGLDEHQVADYVTGDFAKQSPRTQELILEEFENSPDMLMLILMEYRKALGSVPVNLIDAAYELIKDNIS